MSETNEAIDHLRILRSSLVTDRRIIAALAAEQDAARISEKSELQEIVDYGSKLKSIQEQIEAVDRALHDEGQINQSVDLALRMQNPSQA